MIQGQRVEEIAATRYEAEGNIVIRTFKAGCPDLIVIPPEIASAITAAEVKGPGDSKRPHQIATINRLKSQEVNAFFLHVTAVSETPSEPQSPATAQIISALRAMRLRNQAKQKSDTKTTDGGVIRTSSIGSHEIMYPCILCGGLAVGRTSKDGKPCMHCRRRGWAKPKRLQELLPFILSTDELNALTHVRDSGGLLFSRESVNEYLAARLVPKAARA
jgi:hypothetical protein